MILALLELGETRYEVEDLFSFQRGVIKPCHLVLHTELADEPFALLQNILMSLRSVSSNCTL